MNIKRGYKQDITTENSEAKYFKKDCNIVHRRYEMLIVGDSHVRGLSKQVCNCLNDSFSVPGIKKPNADIGVIMSPLHLITDNLTKKKKTIIFYIG